jgi:hypothetical protein
MVILCDVSSTKIEPGLDGSTYKAPHAGGPSSSSAFAAGPTTRADASPARSGRPSATLCAVPSRWVTPLRGRIAVADSKVVLFAYLDEPPVPHPVVGPLALGYGAHFGLGQFAREG